MGKNIVICCDGTGQKLDVQRSNVVRLFSALKRADAGAQICYYDAGVGTLPATGALTSLSRQSTLRAGLLFGYGLLDNVSKAYSFMIDHYDTGDAIYLFGFSRGAFTVRVLAGLLHRIGVLQPEAKNLIPYALERYRPHYTRMKEDARADARVVNDEFRHIFCRAGRVEIRFLGIWDTVKAFGLLWPRSLPHIRHNADVGTVRHALALDEQRRSYVPTSWGGLDDYVETPLAGQNVKEVWFAGSHSDVGGGFSDHESGLARISLEWMITEACKFGLLIDEEPARPDAQLREAAASWPPSDLEKGFWKLHNSRTTRWQLMDLVPRFELMNAPERDASQSNTEAELPVPVGWPNRRFVFKPTTGQRRIEKFRRDGKVLIHASVRDLALAAKYKLRIDGRILRYESLRELSETGTTALQVDGRTIALCIDDEGTDYRLSKPA